MTGRVQFREDEEILAYFEGQGVNPNELARSLLLAEFRRRRAKEKWERLRAVIAKRRDFSGPTAAEMIREDRDSDHGRDPQWRRS